MELKTRITPCLWFDSEAEEAARFYVSVFKKSRIRKITRYGKEGQEIHRRPEGSVMTVEFDLEGHPFTALNGGPVFTFNEAVSFQVFCKTQKEIDYYWGKLTQGGDEAAQQCGWLKDKFGLSWQVVPAEIDRWMGDHTSPRYQRAVRAMLKMKKIDLAGLKDAYEGKDRQPAHAR
jgi:predicted 3-demethylubiquinone-9 3-methyltransferase (glyoxalase superfamily)